MSVNVDNIIKQCILDTFWKRLWGAWKVLKGEASIVLWEIKPKNFYKKPEKDR